MPADPIPKFPDKVQIGTPGTSVGAKGEALKQKYGKLGGPTNKPKSEGVFMITGGELASLMANENAQDYAIIDLRYKTDPGYGFKFNGALDYPCQEGASGTSNAWLLLTHMQAGTEGGRKAWSAVTPNVPFSQVLDKPLVIFHCVSGANRSPGIASGYSNNAAKKSAGGQQIQKIAVLENGIGDVPSSNANFNGLLVQR